jgi:hypothetical protein
LINSSAVVAGSNPVLPDTANSSMVEHYTWDVEKRRTPLLKKGDRVKARVIYWRPFPKPFSEGEGG